MPQFSRTILIVDDSIINRMLLRETFKDEYNTLEAGDGVEALEVLRAESANISVVVLDVTMPKKDGFEVLVEAQADEALHNIPIIIVTSIGEVGNEVKALELGASDFIIKPFDPRSVRQRVKSVIQKREFEEMRLEFSLLQEKQRATEELAYRADHDSLTGIYSKEAFYRLTAEMLRNNPDRAYVLIRWNIERFMLTNELFGKSAGDALLIHLAHQFENWVKDIGTYGRLEADHFVICIPAASYDLDALIAKAPTLLPNASYCQNMIISFGVYAIDDPTLPIDQICDRANLALRTIRGNYSTHYAIYDDKLREAMLSEQAIRDEMDAALENKQFKLYFQPIYSLVSNAPVSAEVLVRWQHPEKGLIPPGVFIPLFERNGFISKLDHYVWEEASRYLKQRRDAGLPDFPISVNASRMSLYNPNLCNEVLALAEKYEVNRSLLRIEITETAYSDNPTQLLNTITELQKNGFLILMDDFGSAYSSLNTLKDIPFDILKIDMKFLEGFERGGRVGTILASVVRMAKWLNVPVIAEGVETKQQIDFLHSVGCERIQGYYFSRPLPEADFEAHLRSAGSARTVPVPADLTENDIDMLMGGSQLITTLIGSVYGGFGIYEHLGDRLEAIRVNQGYYDILGHDSTRPLSEAANIWTYIHEDDRQALLSAFDEARASGELSRVVVRRFSTDGRMIYLDMICRHLGGSGDRSIYCIAFADISLAAQQENHPLIS